MGPIQGQIGLQKPPLRMAKRLELAKGELPFSHSHTHTQTIYRVCVCVLGSNNITPKENEVQSRIGSSSDPFFFFFPFPNIPSTIFHIFISIYMYIRTWPMLTRNALALSSFLALARHGRQGEKKAEPNS